MESVETAAFLVCVVSRPLPPNTPSGHETLLQRWQQSTASAQRSRASALVVVVYHLTALPISKLFAWWEGATNQPLKPKFPLNLPNHGSLEGLGKGAWVTTKTVFVNQKRSLKLRTEFFSNSALTAAAAAADRGGWGRRGWRTYNSSQAWPNKKSLWLRQTLSGGLFCS